MTNVLGITITIEKFVRIYWWKCHEKGRFNYYEWISDLGI